MPSGPARSFATSASPPPAELRRIACRAAAERAPALLEAFRAGPDELRVQTKRNVHDLVTVHDRATEDALVARLSLEVPGSRFVGEEGGHRGPQDADDAGHGPLATQGSEESGSGYEEAGSRSEGAAPRSGQVEWILDPIDGTSNFAHGFAMFSISIAAAVDGEVVAGVVLDPIGGLEFSADDAGAYLNGERFGAGVAVAPPEDADGLRSGAKPSAEAALNVVTSYPSAEALGVDGPAALERFGRLVDTYATVRRTVSGALELAYTAIGWADATLGVDTHPWDVAVGQLLVRRAGGSYLARFYDTDGSECHEPHLAPCYVAVGPGRAASTAVRVLEETVTARREAGYRGR